MDNKLKPDSIEFIQTSLTHKTLSSHKSLDGITCSSLMIPKKTAHPKMFFFWQKNCPVGRCTKVERLLRVLLDWQVNARALLIGLHNARDIGIMNEDN